MHSRSLLHQDFIQAPQIFGSTGLVLHLPDEYAIQRLAEGNCSPNVSRSYRSSSILVSQRQACFFCPAQKIVGRLKVIAQFGLRKTIADGIDEVKGEISPAKIEPGRLTIQRHC